MDVGDAALAGYITLLSGALGALLWTRLNRIEAELASKSSTSEVEAMRGELKADIEVLRKELAGKADKAEVEAMRGELKADIEALRQGIAGNGGQGRRRGHPAGDGHHAVGPDSGGACGRCPPFQGLGG